MNDSSLSAINRDTVVFLFINGAHHVHHLILPALNFARIQNRYRTVLISGNRANSAIIRKTWQTFDRPNCEFFELPKPFRYWIPNYKHKLFPPPYSYWKRIQKYIRHAAAVVSTSHEAPKYFAQYDINIPSLIYLYHGTGTREYGFDPNLDLFDFLFVPGSYHYRRLQETADIDSSKMQIIGQPKLDWLALMQEYQPMLFKNKNPTFYYNPHWDMGLSSIEKWSKPILEYFTINTQYNLIFAPHPLLQHFKNRNGFIMNFKRPYTANNILIDLNGSAGLDGTYNAASDVYIGDVSSMVTEWVCHRPRPCVFLNSHRIDWKSNPSYESWSCGNVVTQISDLSIALETAAHTNESQAKQESYVQRMVLRDDKSVAEHSATILFNFLQGK